METSLNKHIALSERAQRLLKALIERYIRDGTPVGSRSLAREAGLDLSPATVRNEVADLEEMGLVTSPHTSAGRVPTVQGYRFFVDSLMTVESLAPIEVQRLRARLNPDQTVEALLTAASGLLSRITHFASLVMWPRRERTTLRRVQFLPLGEDRVLVVMVLNEREVRSTVLHTGRRRSSAELEAATSYVNSVYGGQDIFAIREALLAEMHEASRTMDQIVSAALEMADQAFHGEIGADDYVVAGETNLLEFADQSNLDRLRQLFEAFSQKRDILNLLDRCLYAEGACILIGAESGHGALTDYSLVTSRYGVGGQTLGVVGVIGPTRMPYEKVVPLVDTTAKLLGEALNLR
jgi:heat-inducible transcriptional repressor